MTYIQISSEQVRLAAGLCRWYTVLGDDSRPVLRACRVRTEHNTVGRKTAVMCLPVHCS